GAPSLPAFQRTYGMHGQSRNRREFFLRVTCRLTERFELCSKRLWSASFHGLFILPLRVYGPPTARVTAPVRIWQASAPRSTGRGRHEHGGTAPGGSRGTVSVKTKAAGSAVVHTYAQGTPGEMETIFHMDGDQLLLTHYCALQNAPVLKFVKSNKPGELKFEF